jgi:hypothetical protein
MWCVVVCDLGNLVNEEAMTHWGGCCAKNKQNEMGCGWSVSRPGHFTRGKDQVPIVQEAEWVPLPVWTDAENLVPTGIRSPDRPARSESLYRLSYPSSQDVDISV